MTKVASLLLAGGLAVALLPVEAWASAGCDAVNAGGINFNIPGSTPFANEVITGKPFSPGDVITATARTDDGSMTGLDLKFLDGSMRSATLRFPIISFSQISITAVGNETSIETDMNTRGIQGDHFVDQVTVTCTPGPPNASSTLLQGSPNAGTLGQSVTFTATVLGTAANGTPTGTVTIDFGDGNSTPAGLSGGVATANHTYAAAGTFTATASYGGDANYVTSSGTVAEGVNKGASTTAIAPTVPTNQLGQTVTFNVTVSGAGTSPTGNVTVNFGDGTSAVATLSGGTGSASHAYSAAGSYTATANYNGDTNYTTSLGTASSETITKGATTTTLVPTPHPSVAGQPVTFAVSVSGAGVTPSGNVTINFGDGTTAASVTLSGGAASAQHTYAASGSFTPVATYGGDTNYNGSSNTGSQSVAQASSSVSLSSSKNPSAFGQPVTLTAIVSGVNPTGTVQFKDGANNLGSPVAISSGQALLTTSSLAAGSHGITAVYAGDSNNGGSTSPSLAQSVGQATTNVTLVSSRNPSEVGQSVTFTATVGSSGGTPAGLVTFLDGSSVLGSVNLSGGIAALATSALTLGSHSITASFAGTANFSASVSAPVIQAVNTPADSLKLRALQVLATPTEAQFSGQAISGAMENAISEGFSGGGGLITPNAGGVRINFAADPDAAPKDMTRTSDPFSSANGTFSADAHGFAHPASSPDASGAQRVDDGFSALAYAAPAKAPPRRIVEEKDWLGWVEVRGSFLERWGSLGAPAAAPVLYGSQVNMLAGLTRRVTPNFVVGVLEGYETFDYRSDALQGRLKGDGWTVGSYLGWKLNQNVRFDAGAAYSGIGYDGTAGAAAGSFGGTRVLLSAGLTGTWQKYAVQIEPSARIYALWENENAYTDSLGTQQTARNFSAGRASAGVKLSYPVAWSPTMSFAPYAGLYGDYYFNNDSTSANALAAASVPPAVLFQGGSARITGGVTAKTSGGAQVSAGFERGGIGSDFAIWSYRARASLPF